ncbi:MAG: nucleoside triphosphate pyrophosphohydrolase [Eggerthellaceae bacterium]|nr:nucleoside triphosphate pyrophosphohydrolase [Eggerthellaceae bacterium]
MPEAEHPAFDHFVSTVAQLRSPEGGCPWNCAQTHASLGDYLIEEAYEALDAIHADDPDHLREELGDLLLQVVLQSQVAADGGEFTIDDVCAGIDEKMIRRHPHVFGNAKAANANEVSELWEQVKLAEKEKADARAKETGAREGLLDSVPTHFPALLQAQKISRKAVAAGFEWETLADVWDKVAEERAELEVAYEAAPKSSDGRVLSEDGRERDPRVTAAEMEFGDLLFALVNVARKMGIDAEAALRASNAKFRRRFAQIERAAWEQGRNVEDLSLNEMEACWQQAKEEE